MGLQSWYDSHMPSPSQSTHPASQTQLAPSHNLSPEHCARHTVGIVLRITEAAATVWGHALPVDACTAWAPCAARSAVVGFEESVDAFAIAEFLVVAGTLTCPVDADGAGGDDAAPLVVTALLANAGTGSARRVQGVGAPRVAASLEAAQRTALRWRAAVTRLIARDRYQYAAVRVAVRVRGTTKPAVARLRVWTSTNAARRRLGTGPIAIAHQPLATRFAPLRRLPGLAHLPFPLPLRRLRPFVSPANPLGELIGRCRGWRPSARRFVSGPCRGQPGVVLGACRRSARQKPHAKFRVAIPASRTAA